VSISLALTGDTILQRRVSACTDGGFLAAVDLVRSATLGFTNLEGCIQTGEDWHAYLAGNGRGATYIRTPPFVGDELAWMGFDLVSLANNHAADFGEAGVLTTMRYLARRPDLVGAGLGATLAEAAAARYVETADGVVALVAAADWGPRGLGDLPFPVPLGALAADADRYYKGRPGLNLLRYDCRFTVPAAALDQLRSLSEQMGWEASKAMRRGGGGRAEPMPSPSPGFDEDEADGSFYFMGRCFVAGDEPGFRTIAYQGDIDRIVRAVREARHHADWVVVSLHQQGAGRRRDEPPDHTVALGRAALEAGADVFVAHGAGRIGGIELFGQSGVAVYGPGSFVIHLDQVRQLPLEMMARFGLGYDGEAGDLLDRRAANERRAGTEVGVRSEPAVFGGAVTVVELTKGRPPQVAVHPIELVGATEGRHLSGLPRLIPSASEQWGAAIAVIDRRSRPFGASVDPAGRVSGGPA
jgi:poly-gamma-glutamate capsule biosynthesis protein CapA/YwtB (metallophosphatase superfamily)